MITAVAFVPQAPALVPEIGRGLDAELGPVRAACREAIRQVAATDVPIVIIATGDELAGYGPVVAGTTVGEWLVRDALDESADVQRLVPDGSPGELTGIDLHGDDPVALVVVGDGSARLSERAPGYLDPEAAERNDLVRRALARGDGALLHPGGWDDERLMVAGSGVWDAVAWEIEASPWDAALIYDGAPFGVGYFVAVWLRQGLPHAEH